MLLSMIVVITSCAPVRAFKHARDRAVERTTDDAGEQDDESPRRTAGRSAIEAPRADPRGRRSRRSAAGPRHRC